MTTCNLQYSPLNSSQKFTKHSKNLPSFFQAARKTCLLDQQNSSAFVLKGDGFGMKGKSHKWFGTPSKGQHFIINYTQLYGTALPDKDTHTQMHMKKSLTAEGKLNSEIIFHNQWRDTPEKPPSPQLFRRKKPELHRGFRKAPPEGGVRPSFSSPRDHPADPPVPPTHLLHPERWPISNDSNEAIRMSHRAKKHFISIIISCGLSS